MKNYIQIKLFFLLVFATSNLFTQNFTAPINPELLAVAYDGKVILTWDKLAEDSIDGLTGYSDFEGYRLYKSDDGGITWGNPETDIIPVNGEIVGWRPIKQFDLSLGQDTTRCVYYNNFDNCVDDTDTDVDESIARSVTVSGSDPVAPWFNLGNDTGLQHFFEDDDVINGVEYTYAITAYDMGVKIDAVIINNETEPITVDTIWNSSNPGKFSCPNGWECPSFESSKLSENFTDFNANGSWDLDEPFEDLNQDNIWNEIRANAINVVTVVPAVNASDISFPSIEELESFLISDSNNSGTGLANYRLVDEASLEKFVVKMEVQALGDEDDFEGFKTRNPYLYAYRVDSINSQNLVEGYYTEYVVSELSEQQILNYLDQPGGRYAEDNIMIHVPTYLFSPPLALEFSDQDGYENNFTPWFSGVQLRADNYWFELPQTSSLAEIADIKYMNIDSNGITTDYEQDLDGNGNPDVFDDEDPENDLSIAYLLGAYDENLPFFLRTGGNVRLSYWGDGFDSRSMFDYKIEFSSSEVLDTAYRMVPNGDSCIDVSLSEGSDYWEGRDEVSFMPFKITNMTTGRQVRYWHTDQGIRTWDGDPDAASGDAGYGDCVWGRNETISFTDDSLAYSDNIIDIDNEKTFQLIIDYSIEGLRGKYGAPAAPTENNPYRTKFPDWSETSSYSIGEIIEVGTSQDDPRAGSLWQAKRDINASLFCNLACQICSIPEFSNQIDCENGGGIWNALSGGAYYSEEECLDQNGSWTTYTQEECENIEGIWSYVEIYPIACGTVCAPNSVYDIDGNNINDNPWKQLYIWEDGDYIEIKPAKWFADGDSWVADLSSLGAKETLTESDLDQILVIPNPYVVSSAYNENVYGERLIFDNLPQECKISIFTITGELVSIINHGSDINLDGTNHWDLKNQNGDIVSPGLYIYTIEAGNLEPKIGKLVIVR